MDDFERRLATLLDEAVPEPEWEIAIDDVAALTRPRLATARRRMRRAARRRAPALSGRRKRQLAVLAAAATAVAVGAASFVLTRGADHRERPLARLTAPAELTATAWQLIRIARPGHAPEPASAPVYFTFGNGASTDHAGDSATTQIARGRITFGVWANDLMLYAVPRLTVAQNNFVFRLLSDTTLKWSINGEALTFDSAGAGSLTFLRSDYDDQHPPVYGSVSGRFMAFGGPFPGTRRPMPGTGTVILTNARNQVQIVDAASGRFYTAIAPGSYTVYGHISSYQGGRVGCAARGSVTVRVDKPAHIDIYCEER